MNGHRAAHHSIEKLLVDALKAVGLNPKTTVNIDVYFTVSSCSFIAEIKSCHARNIHSQTRRGVSQLLEYEYLYSDVVGRPVTKMLVLEMQPVGGKAWLVNYLADLDIFVCWRSPDGTRLQTIATIPSDLQGIICAQE